MICVKCERSLVSGDKVVVHLSGIYDDAISIEGMLSREDIVFNGHIVHKKCKIAEGDLNVLSNL